jgi:hypothetical protein
MAMMVNQSTVPKPSFFAGDTAHLLYIAIAKPRSAL